MMIKKLALVLALTIPIQALSEEYKTVYEDVSSYKKGEPDWYQDHRLNKAYIEQSKVKLSVFLEAWSEISTSHTTHQKSEFPRVFRHAYEIFEDFYQPHNLERIGDPEWGTKQFSKVSYFVVQSKVNVIVTNNLVKDKFGNNSSPTILDATMNNFRPQIKGNIKALFLDDYHSLIIDKFLGQEEIPAGHAGIMSTSKAVGESQKRQDFLNQFLKIYHGHWGGWILETDPTVTKINFNKKYDRAVVYFSLVYEGGEAVYERKNNKWVLIKSELTWIT
jgi:hypothetical protein